MNETQSPPQRGQDLSGLLTLFWRERWLIAVVALAAVSLGSVYVARRGTVWKSTSRLYVERAGPSLLTGDALLAAARNKNYANTQAALIRSTPILTEALAKRGLATRETLQGIKNRIAWLKSNLKVSVGRTDDIIAVSLNSRRPEDSCAIVNAVIERYIAFHSGKKKSTRRAFLQHLEEQRDRNLEELQAAQHELNKFTQANSSLGLGQDDAVTFQIKRLHDVYTAHDLAEQAETTAEQRLLKARSMAHSPGMLGMLEADAGGLDGSFSNPTSAIDSRIWDLQAERELMVAKMTEVHPKVAEIDLHIAALRRQRASYEEQSKAQRQDYVSYLERDWKAAKKLRHIRRSQVLAQEVLVRELTTKNMAFANLKEKADGARQRIAALTKLSEQLSLASIDEEEKGLLNVMVLDPAHEETSTVITNTIGPIGISLILGLLAGFGLAFLRGSLDQRVRNVEDITQGLRLALLGTVPHTEFDKHEVDAIGIWEERSRVAEALRSIRTAVYFGLPEGENRVIQITSADPSEGKSMTASLLGIAMAQAGQRTLIVDADLRLPTQVRRFGLRDEAGLSSILAGEARLRDVIQKTDVPGLDVMTSGPLPDNPAEALSGPRFGRMLELLGKHYDRILVDSAPVLPVADSRILAPKCDGTVLVTRAARTSRRRAQAARDIILSGGGTIVGSVLNGLADGVDAGYGTKYVYGKARDGGDYVLTAAARRQKQAAYASKAEKTAAPQEATR